ncbi:hypothetical protein [Amycolatopsis sp. NPDC059657]|uniref:hypothetical protein n=1 Tax=Amycolatopsis sp. NPDC059657 TaxID=3346899 RepID=UPI00366F8BC3
MMVVSASSTSARLANYFRAARFDQDVTFGGARFADMAVFDDAVFHDFVGFNKAVFAGQRDLHRDETACRGAIPLHPLQWQSPLRRF